MKKGLKRLIAVSLISFSLLSLSDNIYAQSSDLLYEDREIQTLTGGVTYEKSSRLYKGGWMDIYVLTADLTNPNVQLDVLESVTEYGLKKSVQSLAKENNAVAAVNADFFSSGNPRSSMGQVIKDGSTKATANYYNGSENRYSGFFVDGSGVAFIDYLKSVIGFYASDNVSLELQAKNKITDFSKPVYFDRQAMTTTADIDKRYSGLYKICVSNGEISKISYSGETVEIPADGYIIVMNYSTGQQKISQFSVGQKVSFTESEKFLFRPEKSITEVSLGVSGGGELLRNGQVVSQGLIIGEKSRNPRTAVGVSQDKTKVIILAIDGRGASIGATHTEVANLMKEYGAYDAIHFDGGGSTTVAVKQEGSSDVSVVNTPSEGSQRYVANALGIKAVSEPGPAASLSVSCSNGLENILFSGSGSSFSVKAFDANHNPVEINADEVTFSSDGIDGQWDGNKFIPSSEGSTTIVARLGDIAGSADYKVISGAQFFNATAQKRALQTGESTYLIGSLTNKDGYSTEVNFKEISWSVDNSSVGYVDGGKFIATGDGTAVLTAEHNGLTDNVAIVVGKTDKVMETFESTKNIYMSYYPTDKEISGSAGITPAYSHDGSSSLMLSYNFEGSSTQTQAAYACFDNDPITIHGEATNIGMWVKGDKSGNLLKAVIRDSNGSTYPLTLVNSLDFDEWQYAQAEVPSDAAYPIVIEKIYVAALETTAEQHSKVFIDTVSALVPSSELPEYETPYRDYKKISIQGAPAPGEEEITLFGQTANRPGGEISEAVLQKVLSAMSQNVRSMLFVGPTNITNNTGVPALWWKNSYFTTNTDNISIINLATGSGSIRGTKPEQWQWLPGYLNGFSKNNIIINLDRNIWDSNNDFTDSRENIIFHKILKDFVLETGKNVMVVSASGTSSDTTVVDGVRYVNLNGLSSYTPENTSGYSYLRVRATSDDMFYCLQGID